MLRGTPHALTVLVRDDGEPMEQCAEGGRGALERYRQISAGLSGTGGMEGVAVLRNSLPVWNEGMAAFTLPFYSRAQLPSKKNFHIVRWHGRSAVSSTAWQDPARRGPHRGALRATGYCWLWVALRTPQGRHRTA